MMKYLSLDDEIYQYLVQWRSGAGDPLLQALREETVALGDVARMLISEEEGSLLTLLTGAAQARSAIEIGTFTGYSSICIARGLAEGGRLICIDESEEWTQIARDYWRKAGVEPKIELRLGEAIPLLERLEPGITFDLAFIDAAKEEYDAYYESVLPYMRPNGLIILDNMLWDGRLSAASEDPSAQALDALNRKLATDERVESVLLPIADGIQLCRKR